jgi:general secretion pathway protein D
MRVGLPRGRSRQRHLLLTLRLLLCSLLISLACLGAALDEPVSETNVAVAKRLADLAKQAFRSSQTVRAYLLLVEASKRDPRNATYRDNRSSLEATAKILIAAHLETADIAKDIQAVEEEVANPTPPIVPMETPGPEVLRSLPHVEAASAKHNFDLHGDQMTLFQQVAAAYGVRVAWDPQLAREPNLSFHLDDADWQTAMDALTAATDTFVFPTSAHAVFFVHDSEVKRNEFEPVILQTVTLPDAVLDKDLIEAANAVRAVLNLRAFGWDSANRTVLIRDRFTRAHVARNLLQALLVPKAQVSLEVQFLTLDGMKTYHYGVSLQNMFQLVNLGHIGNLQQLTPNFGTVASNFLTFGTPGGVLLAMGITDASLFASYSNSLTTSNYDATVVADDATTVTLHVGEKYPIPTSLFSGASQVAGSIYNPTAQISMEDLGLVLKMTPRVNGEGEIALEVEAEFKTLGSLVFNTVPSVNQRKYTGAVTLREGQWAVIAGMDEKSTDAEQDGVAGLSSIPGLKHVFSEHTKSTELSDTLVVIKPTITRLPMSPQVSPKYFLGPVRGARVLL